MILLSFLFLVSFVFLLSTLPVSLPNGIAGDWVSAAWILKPVGQADLPLPILMGKVAFFLFPFGPPAFRMNLAGACLVAFTPILAFRMFTLVRPRPAPGPTLLELDEARKWAAISFLAILIGVVSPAFPRAGTNGLAPALALFFPLLTLERFFSWRRTRRDSVAKWLKGVGLGVAGGLTLTLDLRWGLLLPALLFWRPGKIQFKTGLLPILMGLTLAVSFLVPWMVLVSFQVATFHQLMETLPSFLAGGLFHWSHRGGGDHSAFLFVGGLLLLYGFARGMKTLSARFPRGVPSTLGLILVAEMGWFFLHPPRPSFTESETNDLFRSLPVGSTFVSPQAETVGAATYAQTVLGKRRDIRLVHRKDSALLTPADGETLFMEPVGKIGEKKLPMGFVLQPLDFPITALSSPLAQVSLGRVPMILAESSPPSSFLGQAHQRLGETFAQLQIPDQAEEEFLAALAVAPQDSAASEALGRLWMEYGEKKRAAAALNRTQKSK